MLKNILSKILRLLTFLKGLKATSERSFQENAVTISSLKKKRFNYISLRNLLEASRW